ncbi:MAG: hypothetical protein CMJ78_26655 [Planctomycetaceae bacterium]|nr:hypothetical protein [Planctomycetaceae bacterium]
MLTPTNHQTQCPSCGSPVLLSNAARLQARELGVSCICHSCDCEWMHIEETQPMTTAELAPEPQATEIALESQNAINDRQASDSNVEESGSIYNVQVQYAV